MGSHPRLADERTAHLVLEFIERVTDSVERVTTRAAWPGQVGVVERRTEKFAVARPSSIRARRERAFQRATVRTSPKDQGAPEAGATTLRALADGLNARR
jgi:hypothetical protein